VTSRPDDAHARPSRPDVRAVASLHLPSGRAGESGGQAEPASGLAASRPAVCQERFGTHPVQVCHEWSTIAHLNDYEGRA
jgi:hypothetical protein